MGKTGKKMDWDRLEPLYYKVGLWNLKLSEKYYHVTGIDRVKPIISNGLLPGQDKKVYFITSKDYAPLAAMDRRLETYALFEIDKGGVEINSVSVDPIAVNFAMTSFYSNEPIDKRFIRFIGQYRVFADMSYEQLSTFASLAIAEMIDGGIEHRFISMCIHKEIEKHVSTIRTF